MTMEKYVKTIIKKIKCSPGRRKEIRQQLLSEISAAKENGEELSQIIARMGPAASVAAEFNENISSEELKKYKRGKRLKIGGLIGVILVLLVFGIYWVLPKGAELEKGGLFKERMVRAQMQNVIDWVDAEDYEALKEHSIPLLKSTFEGDTFSQAKATLSDNWGTRKVVGNFYLAQFTQMGKTYALGQVTVSYENVSVTYTLTLDTDLQLAGIYIR